MEEINLNKKEEHEEKNKTKEEYELNSYLKAIDVYYILIKVVLEDNNITTFNFEKKIKQYKNNKNLSYLEKIIIQLLINLNPKSQNFKSFLNRKFAINLLNYLSKIKVIKRQNEEINMKNESEIGNVSRNAKKINAIEVLKICSDVYGDRPLYKILFKELYMISKKEEYLIIIILILPDPEKDIQKIIEVVAHYYEGMNKKELIDLFQDITRRIDLNQELGFQYLKEVIILFITIKIIL